MKRLGIAFFGLSLACAAGADDEGQAAGDCSDDADNDGDGDFDCDDAGCAGSDLCASDPGDDGVGTADTPDCAPEGTGYGVGDVSFDVSGEDQDGDTWSLYEHCDEPVVLLFAIAADGASQAAAGDLADLGVETAVLFVDGASASERADWAQSSGVDFPLLASDEATFEAFGGEGFVPWYAVLDEGSVIVSEADEYESGLDAVE